ncbi:RNA polymerase sigma factor [Solitalea koreensis]|uniref:RNA polymerase sigma-70 factor, ECF subfamily n=1 Tax=Solitalea koreensis TaxID=543615 RepID=A0A521B1K1_9SPHI|nr:sigma-70 family RNA polymerase sigma factor [Solitalea koreensis]SMO40911.1 RNA polymerase sigma-70 factor, ECF subfamily [Solitalea koreensis]
MAKRVTLSEEELVRALHAKQKIAMDALYAMYSAALYGIISRIVQVDEEAEDVLQEVFLKIWNNGAYYDSTKGRLFTWMANIARNQAIDKIRSKSFKNEVKNQDLEDNVDTIDVFKNLSMSPDHIGLKDLLNKLKPEHKIVVELVYFNGYKQQEVADELDIPLGTVKTRLRMAILELRKYFN